jgi:hypothetical protein
MVPLASLLAYELKNDVEENPILRCGLALQPRKGEDFALINTNCQRLQDDGSSTFAVFGVSFFFFSESLSCLLHLLCHLRQNNRRLCCGLSVMLLN